MNQLFLLDGAQAAARSAPGDHRWPYLQGVVALTRGDSEGAENRFSFARELEPEDLPFEPEAADPMRPPSESRIVATSFPKRWLPIAFSSSPLQVTIGIAGSSRRPWIDTDSDAYCATGCRQNLIAVLASINT